MDCSRLIALLQNVHAQRISSVDVVVDEDEDAEAQGAQMSQAQVQCCQIMTRSVVCSTHIHRISTQ